MNRSSILIKSDLVVAVGYSFLLEKCLFVSVPEVVLLRVRLRLQRRVFEVACVDPCVERCVPFADFQAKVGHFFLDCSSQFLEYLFLLLLDCFSVFFSFFIFFGILLPFFRGNLFIDRLYHHLNLFLI